MLLISVKSDADVGTIFLEQLEQLLLHVRGDGDGATLSAAVSGLAIIGGALPELIGIARWDGVKHALESPCQAEGLLGEAMLAALFAALQEAGIEDGEGLLLGYQLMVALIAGAKLVYWACLVVAYGVYGTESDVVADVIDHNDILF